jgi:hypothetical protein
MPSTGQTARSPHAIAFIDDVLRRDLKAAVESASGTVSFALIAQGVTTLGALVDGGDLQNDSLAERRFSETVRHFFPSRYAAYNSPNAWCLFHEATRFAVFHSLRKSSRVALFRRADASAQGLYHLTIWEHEGERRLVFVLEDFFEDFCAACEAVKAHLAARS